MYKYTIQYFIYGHEQPAPITREQVGTILRARFDNPAQLRNELHKKGWLMLKSSAGGWFQLKAEWQEEEEQRFPASYDEVYGPR